MNLLLFLLEVFEVIYCFIVMENRMKGAIESAKY